MKEVLDSRLFAVLFFEDDERLRDAARSKLRQLRREGRGVIPSIVVAEVLNLVCREAGRELARTHQRAIEASGLAIVPLDGTLAAEAGLIRCHHRELPLADAIIAALALALDGKVVSDDAHFSLIPGLRVGWLN